jgi:hypothetical protein
MDELMFGMFKRENGMRSAKEKNILEQRLATLSSI